MTFDDFYFSLMSCYVCFSFKSYIDVLIDRETSYGKIRNVIYYYIYVYIYKKNCDKGYALISQEIFRDYTLWIYRLRKIHNVSRYILIDWMIPRTFVRKKKKNRSTVSTTSTVYYNYNYTIYRYWLLYSMLLTCRRTR